MDNEAGGEGYVSDESSFWGTPSSKARLEAQAERPHSQAWFTKEMSRLRDPMAHPNNLALAHRGKSNGDDSGKRAGDAALPFGNPEDHDLWSPGQGEMNVRQLLESPSEFVTRISPTSTAAATFDWLWVHDPHRSRQHVASRDAQMDLAAFSQAGSDVLHELESAREAIETENPGMNAATVTRKLKPARDEATRDIYDAAKSHHVRGGKWLVFGKPQDIFQMWLKVVEGTVAGELGCTAKVATPSLGLSDDGGEVTSSDHGVRVICIYTSDFEDEDEAKRVLQGLRRRKVIGPADNVSYKTDAMTYLGVYTKNPWKLSPSLYFAKDYPLESGPDR